MWGISLLAEEPVDFQGLRLAELVILLLWAGHVAQVN